MPYKQISKREFIFGIENEFYVFIYWTLCIYTIFGVIAVMGWWVIYNNKTAKMSHMLSSGENAEFYVQLHIYLYDINQVSYCKYLFRRCLMTALINQPSVPFPVPVNESLYAMKKLASLGSKPVLFLSKIGIHIIISIATYVVIICDDSV